MRLERFRGSDLPTTLERIRASLGPDAMILDTRTTLGGGLEVLATPPGEVEALRRQLDGPGSGGIPLTPSRIRPWTVALVGSAGSGKTTALMKLALHPRAFGGKRVGLLTLDTYRVGGLAEIRAYAEVTGLPVEVLHDEEDVDGALRRLRECEVVLVDTPGRLNPEEGGLPEWVPILQRLECDEVHLVCPAGIRPSLVRHQRWRFHPCGLTHCLLTRMDEAPRDGAILEVAHAAKLPARWVASGHQVTEGLTHAWSGIMAAVVGTRPAASPRESSQAPEKTILRQAVG
ncbi:MAG: hypothetical protein EA421_01515 [Gemmatimonadales bacterium]|nr:MAG: hypothetical protein EA421_01515 [Gemmatimonadales bacterium]